MWGAISVYDHAEASLEIATLNSASPRPVTFICEVC